jgi:malate synthase
VNKKYIIKSIRVCGEYYVNWLEGKGVVSYNNLMEDMATVEICRI